MAALIASATKYHRSIHLLQILLKALFYVEGIIVAMYHSPETIGTNKKEYCSCQTVQCTLCVTNIHWHFCLLLMVILVVVVL